MCIRDRFKPCPGRPPEIPITELAVWSGDQVMKDEEGFLYFISRKDEMIKTSGYRVSPGEIEEVIHQMPAVEQAVAFGAPHPQLGYGIVALVQADPEQLDTNAVMSHCGLHLPMFMLPGHIEIVRELPRNPNGKLDRKALSLRFAEVFTDPK